MLGQGPYTPWQMAAWGLVGLAGAALGALSRRRLGRVPLALACALAALVAKEIMNLYTWTLGASHTPAAFLAVAAPALPFDLTDTVASFFFGLAFGPELARLLARMRARMDVSWEPSLRRDAGARLRRRGARARSALAAPPLALLARRSCASSRPARRRSGVADAASSSYPALAPRTPTAASAAPRAAQQRALHAWAAIGLAAAGRDPAELRPRRPLGARRAAQPKLDARGPRRRRAHDPRAARLRRLRRTRSPGAISSPKCSRARASDDSFEHLVNLTAFAIFALRAVGHSAAVRRDPRSGGLDRAPAERRRRLRLRRARLARATSTTPAAALQALVDAGARDGACSRAPAAT